MQIVSARQKRPKSVTHQHLSTVIATLVRQGQVEPREGRLRILDIGCGDGELVSHLQQELTAAFPDLAIELYGFDIGEQGYRDEGQFETTSRSLAARFPDVDWRQRISIISDSEPWCYPAEFFDVATSNQVLEHVEDLPRFLSELRRCLSPKGASVHLFPLSSCAIEAHCQTPFAHWIQDFDRRSDWIALMSWLGIGSYRRHRSVLGHRSRREHAVETAKYIQCWTRYRSFAAIAGECCAAHLAVSSGFTGNFFVAKLRSVLKMPAARSYRLSRIPLLGWLGFVVGRYLSSSTLVIRPMSYDIGRRIAAEKAAARGKLRVAASSQ